MPGVVANTHLEVMLCLPWLEKALASLTFMTPSSHEWLSHMPENGKTKNDLETTLPWLVFDSCAALQK